MADSWHVHKEKNTLMLRYVKKRILINGSQVLSLLRAHFLTLFTEWDNHGHGYSSTCETSSFSKNFLKIINASAKKNKEIPVIII